VHASHSPKKNLKNTQTHTKNAKQTLDHQQNGGKAKLNKRYSDGWIDRWRDSMHLEAMDRWFHPQFDSLKWKGTNVKEICQGKRTEMEGY